MDELREEMDECLEESHIHRNRRGTHTHVFQIQTHTLSTHVNNPCSLMVTIHGQQPLSTDLPTTFSQDSHPDPTSPSFTFIISYSIGHTWLGTHTGFLTQVLNTNTHIQPLNTHPIPHTTNIYSLHTQGHANTLSSNTYTHR